MDPSQQQLLNKIILEYLNVMPLELAASRMGVIKEQGMENVYFGWAGALDRSAPHYYRIQGNTFLIEFDNAQNGANHVHSVWRDFDGDFGRDVLREHYDAAHDK